MTKPHIYFRNGAWYVDTKRSWNQNMQLAWDWVRWKSGDKSDDWYSTRSLAH